MCRRAGAVKLESPEFGRRICRSLGPIDQLAKEVGHPRSRWSRTVIRDGLAKDRAIDQRFSPDCETDIGTLFESRYQLLVGDQCDRGIADRIHFSRKDPARQANLL